MPTLPPSGPAPGPAQDSVGRSSWHQTQLTHYEAVTGLAQAFPVHYEAWSGGHVAAEKVGACRRLVAARFSEGSPPPPPPLLHQPAAPPRLLARRLAAAPHRLHLRCLWLRRATSLAACTAA